MNYLHLIWLLLLIPLGVLIWASGWRPSRPSMPNVKINWSLWGFLWKAMALIMVLMVILGMWSCVGCIHSWSKPSPAKVGTKALIPRFDGFTPCDPTFDYPFELDTQGDPITMDVPGIGKVHYSGKGVLDLGEKEEKRTPGPVHTTSDDSRKQARVRIWEVVYVNQ